MLITTAEGYEDVNDGVWDEYKEPHWSATDNKPVLFWLKVGNILKNQAVYYWKELILFNYCISQHVKNYWKDTDACLLEGEK